MSLVEALDRYKKANNIKTDIELASKFGITSDYLSKIRRGIRQPGNLVWRAIVNDAPPLIPHMLLYFQSLDLNTRKELSDLQDIRNSYPWR